MTMPRPLDSFIGRAEELQAVSTLLAAHRLVTLTGAAGVGKTRLALRIAEALNASYPDGVCFVALVELTDPALVPQAVASALGLREEPDRSLLQTLTGFLSSRAVLLVWDNCDYLVPGCRALAQALLGACPQVRILATSRRSLHLNGEVLHTVPPFGVPEAGAAALETRSPAEVVAAYEALQLFQQRAREKLAGFEITPENLAAVAQICRRLDGIPLALELAAGRIRELSADQLATRLDERFHLLIGGSSALTHQQTLGTAVGWSYDLLSAPERRLLARLSVFAGGWDLEAAEAVVSGDGVRCSVFGLRSSDRPTPNTEHRTPNTEDRDPEVLDLITGLIDKSWIVGETRQGVRRYRLLETVREYSKERLKEAGEEAEVRARHAAFFLQLAEEADAELTRLVQAAWLDRLESEYENLRAALAWCASAENGAEIGLRLARALVRFWEVRGYLSEGRAYLAEALGREGASSPTPERAGALNGAAVLAWMQGDFGASRALFEESLAIERAAGDPYGCAWSIHHLGHVAAEQGDYEMAQGLYEESLAIFRELGDAPGIAASLADQGNAALKQGDYEAARTLYEESLRISRELGNKVSIAVSLNNLGKIARDQGDPRAARALHAESLAIRLELGDKGGFPWSLEAFARLAAPDQPERAARLWGAAENLRESLGLPLPPNEREEYDRHRNAARAALGAALFAGVWAEGRALPLEQAVEYALRDETVQSSGVRVQGRKTVQGSGFTVQSSDPDRLDPEPCTLNAEPSFPPEPRTLNAEPSSPPEPPFPMLATKLALPALSPSLLPRPRLMARLDGAAGGGGRPARLALLVASAGSGKTSLVSQWLRTVQGSEFRVQGTKTVQSPEFRVQGADKDGLYADPPPLNPEPSPSIAWLSLDAEDNEPARFLLYLCAALEGVAPAAAGPVRALLQAAERPSPEAALTLLLNGVAALEQPVTLVLDDYQEIAADAAHRLVAFLVEHLPPPLFLILTTRSDPPLPLARLRLQGRLIEIRDEELRFTSEEAAQFLNERMGLALPPERVDLLAERTEGWIAGLQLAALSLQGETDPDGFLDAFAGSNRYLVDYLFEEVLRRQPPDVQAFLGQTAFLDRLCGPLCEAVTGAPGGQAMLERLEAAHLFLIPLDQERRWYRYHRLFADVLRARLLPPDTDARAALHGRAASWYEAEGMAAEAIEHALAGGQFERAARLVERHGEAERVIARLERLLAAREEPERPRDAPAVRVLLAVLHWQAGHREQAVTVLEPVLRLAAQEGEVRVFLEAGPGLIPVLRQAAAQGIAPETVGRLLAGSAGAGEPRLGARDERQGVPAQRVLEPGPGPASAAGAPPTGGPSPTLLEPLSDRELEVLRLLAAGLPNKEIAAQLYLAVGTVKRHVYNLYGKLGATSRTGAVARGRELGLL